MKIALLLAAALAAKPTPTKSAKGKYYALESLIGLKVAELDKGVCAKGKFERLKGLSAGGHDLELWRCPAMSSLIDALDDSKAFKGFAPPESFVVLGVEDGKVVTAEASKTVETSKAEDLYSAIVAALHALDCKNEDDQSISFAVTDCGKKGPGFEVINHLMREPRHDVSGAQHTMVLQAGRDLATVEQIHQALK